MTAVPFDRGSTDSGPIDDGVERDPDGLAMSSRNAYLSKDERKTAPVLHATLQTLAKQIRAGEDIAKAALSHWGLKSGNQKGGGNV